MLPTTPQMEDDKDDKPRLFETTIWTDWSFYYVHLFIQNFHTTCKNITYYFIIVWQFIMF